MGPHNRSTHETCAREPVPRRPHAVGQYRLHTGFQQHVEVPGRAPSDPHQPDARSQGAWWRQSRHGVVLQVSLEVRLREGEDPACSPPQGVALCPPRVRWHRAPCGGHRSSGRCRSRGGGRRCWGSSRRTRHRGHEQVYAARAHRSCGGLRSLRRCEPHLLVCACEAAEGAWSCWPRHRDDLRDSRCALGAIQGDRRDHRKARDFLRRGVPWCRLHTHRDRPPLRRHGRLPGCCLLQLPARRGCRRIL
mmetsp:Transcript_71973/g.153930  ORF Transcript_71973/g.153930 Transcript_71973/m.153930 type:complete len:248 (+) Transcript_71973:458-1201(+)